MGSSPTVATMIDEIGIQAGLIPKNGLTMMGGNWRPEQVRLRNDIRVRVPYQSCVNKRLLTQHGRVVELVDTHDSKSCAERRVGSSPTLATFKMLLWQNGGKILRELTTAKKTNVF